MGRTIEELLETPYWIVDILPKRVPADGGGQYFAVEQYLRDTQCAEIKKKHLNLLLKLNCYRDISLEESFDENGEENQKVNGKEDAEDNSENGSESRCKNGREDTCSENGDKNGENGTERGMINPPPAQIADAIRCRYVIIRVDDALIVSDPEDTYLTVYHPDDELLELVRELAAGEGMFVWK